MGRNSQEKEELFYELMLYTQMVTWPLIDS